MILNDEVTQKPPDLKGLHVPGRIKGASKVACSQDQLSEALRVTLGLETLPFLGDSVRYKASSPIRHPWLPLILKFTTTKAVGQKGCSVTQGHTSLRACIFYLG